MAPPSTLHPIRIALPALLFLAIFPLRTNAQEGRPRNHGATMLEQGLALEAEQQHAEAIALYSTVHRSDSAYHRVLLQEVSARFNLKEHALLLPLCDKGAALHSSSTVQFMLYKAAALGELERYEESLAVHDSVISAFPGLHLPGRLRALTLRAMDEPERYLAALKENAVRFPLAQANHIALAAAAQQEGHVSQAALSLFMALMVRWNDEASLNALSDADKLLDGKMTSSPKGLDLGSGDDFQELDLLLSNRVGMNKNYPAKPDLNYAIARQGHLLMHALNDHAQGDGFWSTYYVPFMKSVVDAGLYEAFIYHALSNSSETQVRAIADKNQAAVKQFREAVYPLMKQAFLHFPDSVGDAFIPVDHYYNDNGDLQFVGAGGSFATATGPWVEYGTNGRVLSRGAFNAQHEKTGVWEHFHPDGTLMRRQVWDNGAEKDVYLTWHPNGTLKDSAAVEGGRLHGPYANFSSLGALVTRKTFTDAKLTGPARTFHPCGTLRYAEMLEDNRTNGPVTVLYADGKEQFTMAFEQDKRTGHSIEHGRNGRMSSDFLFENGLREGAFTEWHPSGQKRAEGSYTADKLTGKRTVWHENGRLSEEELRDPQGRATGLWTSYSVQGPKVAEMDYVRDQLVRYRFFDASGKLLSEGKRAKGKFSFTGHTSLGAKRMEGDYLDEGAKDGPWTWWYPDGTVSSEENLKAGQQEGLQRSYTTSGKLYLEKRFLPGLSATGPYTQYYPDGSVEDQGWLEDDVLEGEQWRMQPDGTMMAHEYFVAGVRDGWQRYYDRDGVLYEDNLYRDGITVERIKHDEKGNPYEHIVLRPGHFEWQEHFPDGRLLASYPYVNGVISGVGTTYYPDGSKRSEITYLNGQEHGSARYWHPNGQMSYEAFYDLGQPTGTRTRWNSQGIAYNIETFEDGRSTGYTTYHPNGMIAMERQARFGADHGEVRTYDPTGELQLVRYYADGQLIGYGYNGPDGNLVDTIPLGEGLVRLQATYANGRPSREMTYLNGEAHGIFREFHPNGQLMEESTYESGDRTGPDHEFHADGTPLATTHWANGEQHGEQLAYWPNGQVRERINYVHGLRHGPAVFHDEAGNAVLELTYRNGEAVSLKKP